jgi:putative membrane protein
MNRVRRLRNGFLAGIAGTVPMTAAMELFHRWLPFTQRYALPPRQITADLVATVLPDTHIEEQQLTVMTITAHFAFGGAAGGVYALLEPEIPLPAVVKGMIFGLVVWSSSYLGWLPALGIRRSATRAPAQRNTLMIVAHLIWGGTTGLVVDRLEAR